LQSATTERAWRSSGSPTRTASRPVRSSAGHHLSDRGSSRRVHDAVG